MTPGTRTILVVVVAACIVGAAGWWWISNQEPDISHEEAMAAWPDLVANNFQDDRKRIAKTFIRCFRVGDPISKYAELLRSAQRRWGMYEWDWDLGHGGEGDAVFVLHVEGNPPTITDVFIAPICH